VVAFARDAAEVIDDGITGLVVADSDEMRPRDPDRGRATTAPAAARTRSTASVRRAWCATISQ
jgi:hypothetical protein